jgi:hypothetical protein
MIFEGIDHESQKAEHSENSLKILNRFCVSNSTESRKQRKRDDHRIGVYIRRWTSGTAMNRAIAYHRNVKQKKRRQRKVRNWSTSRLRSGQTRLFASALQCRSSTPWA